MKKIGFTYVALDLAGYKYGRMNDALDEKTKEKITHFPLNLHLMFCALLTQSNPVTGDKTNPVFARSTAKTGNITIK